MKNVLRYSLVSALFIAALSLSSCTGNTDDATNSADTEKHGTAEEQFDSTRAAADSTQH